MKSKICSFSIIGLIIIILFLLWIIFNFILENISKPKIPNYNYHISQLAMQYEGDTLPVSLLNSGNWDKVCFLGPYSGHSPSNNWDININDFTNVLNSDGHNVLVFLKNNTVEDFIIQSRIHGNFSTLSGTCKNRNEYIEL